MSNCIQSVGNSSLNLNDSTPEHLLHSSPAFWDGSLGCYCFCSPSEGMSDIILIHNPHPYFTAYHDLIFRQVETSTTLFRSWSFITGINLPSDTQSLVASYPTVCWPQIFTTRRINLPSDPQNLVTSSPTNC